jgi:hypothetical protein
MANRQPTSVELGVLALWSELGGPALSQWIRPESAIDIAADGG